MSSWCRIEESCEVELFAKVKLAWDWEHLWTRRKCSCQKGWCRHCKRSCRQGNPSKKELAAYPSAVWKLINRSWWKWSNCCFGAKRQLHGAWLHSLRPNPGHTSFQSYAATCQCSTRVTEQHLVFFNHITCKKNWNSVYMLMFQSDKKISKIKRRLCWKSHNRPDTLEVKLCVAPRKGSLKWNLEGSCEAVVERPLASWLSERTCVCKLHTHTHTHTHTHRALVCGSLRTSQHWTVWHPASW